MTKPNRKLIIDQAVIDAQRQERQEAKERAKADLGRYKECLRLVAYHDSRLQYITSQLEPGGIKPKMLAPGVPDMTSNFSGAVTRVEDGICKKMEVEKELDAARAERDRVRVELMGRIDLTGAKDPDFPRILKARYIDCMGLAAIEMGYSFRAIRYKHDAALIAYGAKIP